MINFKTLALAAIAATTLGFGAAPSSAAGNDWMCNNMGGNTNGVSASFLSDVTGCSDQQTQRADQVNEQLNYECRRLGYNGSRGYGNGCY